MKRFVTVALAITVFLTTPLTAAEIELPERVDNAAIHYWAAVALLPRAQTQEEIDAIEFIEGDLQKLPPAALEGKELVIGLLRKNKDSMRELREGALKTVSNFDLAYEDGPAMLLSHLMHMRTLTWHALAVALLHQYEGEAEKAIEIYGDLVKMAAHLDQDKNLISGLLGCAIVAMTTQEIEGFLSREPDGDASELLLKAIDEVPAKPLDIADSVRAEAQVSGDWYLRTLPSKADELVEISGISGKILTGLSASEKEQLVKQWIAEYRKVLNEFAAALQAPYWQTRHVIQAMEKSCQDANSEHAQRSPLIPLFVPALSRAADQFALPEAKLAMCRILCAASLLKARTGKYPEAISELAEFFPDGLPLDPFTGKDYTYRLEGGMPYIRCNPPDELWKKRPSNYECGLSRRLREDGEALKKYRAEQSEDEEHSGEQP